MNEVHLQLCAGPGLTTDVGDVSVPIDPATLPFRLESAGFSDVVVEQAEGRVRFAGRAGAVSLLRCQQW